MFCLIEKADFDDLLIIVKSGRNELKLNRKNYRFNQIKWSANIIHLRLFNPKRKFPKILVSLLL